MTEQFQIPIDMNLLTVFFTEALAALGNRRSEIRQALADAFARYQNHVGRGTEIKVDSAVFEQLATNATRLFDEYQQARDENAIAVGGGVVAEIVRDDDFQDLTEGKL